ncbi:MAG TPA: hypothetical protein VM871_09990, partial [Flavisolibacter sp.]|nr:hypothetical protein [Flavisolibacter sp.]
MRYLLTVIVGLLTLGIFYSCQKELSTEVGLPAKGNLLDAAGDCAPKTVRGSYVAATALTDSNFIEVTVNVTSPGSYTIFTDTLNGYAFKATGTFASTGANVVRLKATGKPAVDGTDDFTVFFDVSACLVSVTVLPAGSGGGPAIFSLAGSPGACASFIPSGNYIKDSTLDSRHFVTVNVNVTTVGSYSISTNTVNGYSFSSSGTFGATGVQPVVLNGAGKPLATGTNLFTATAGGSTCSFSIPVTTASSAGCNPVVQGTYTAGTPTTAANKVTLSHTYATAGPHTVTTGAAINGYAFGPTVHTATVGANTVTLTATGTPTTAGSNTFTVDFGDGSNCTFTVTVVSV